PGRTWNEYQIESNRQLGARQTKRLAIQTSQAIALNGPAHLARYGKTDARILQAIRTPVHQEPLVTCRATAFVNTPEVTGPAQMLVSPKPIRVHGRHGH